MTNAILETKPKNAKKYKEIKTGLLEDEEDMESLLKAFDKTIDEYSNNPDYTELMIEAKKLLNEIKILLVDNQ